MDALICLKTRRSIRAYEDRQVDEALLAQVLEAGMYAPTGMGRQSPKMVVVQDRATRDQLSRMNAAVMNSTGDPFYGAPTVIVVLADPAVGTWREDGSLVMGNLMNAAHAVGLGSCWIHRAYEEFQSAEGKALLKNGACRRTTWVWVTASWAMPRVRPGRPRSARRIMWCVFDLIC